MPRNYCSNGTYVKPKQNECDFVTGNTQGTELFSHIVLTIGIIGITFNILTLVILQKINKKNQLIRVLMSAIAVSDIIEILNYVMSDSFNYIFDSHGHPYQQFMRFNFYWITPFQAITMTFNRWLIVILSLNSWIVIRDATHFKMPQSGVIQKRFRKGITALILLGILSVLLNLPVILHFDYDICQIYEGLKPVSSITISLSEKACEKTYLWGYSTFFDLAANILLPASLLLSINVYIVIKLRDIHSTLSSVGANSREDSTKSMTIMCSIIAWVYLVLHIPFIIHKGYATSHHIASCDIRECLKNFCSCQFNNNECTEVEKIINETLCYSDNIKINENGVTEEKTTTYATLGLILNCSVNFFLYLLTSNSFRKKCLEMMGCRRLVPLFQKSTSESSSQPGTLSSGVAPGSPSGIEMKMTAF